MGILQNILEEELAGSVRMQRAYARALQRLPKGVLVRKRIRGHRYYYLLKRERGRVRFDYVGKQVPAEMVRRHRDAKRWRAKYRKLLAQVTQQIVFLRRALRGRSRRAVA